MPRIIERLYGMSGELNEKGQSSFYGKNGGTVITGNEDGIKHCAMSILHVDPSCRSFMRSAIRDTRSRRRPASEAGAHGMRSARSESAINACPT